MGKYTEPESYTIKVITCASIMATFILKSKTNDLFRHIVTKVSKQPDNNNI